MPTYSDAENRAMYDAWWAVKFAAGRWISFVRARLDDGRPVFITFADHALVAALAMQVRPVETKSGEYVVSFAGWNVYQELVTKLNTAGYRCVIVDAPLPLVTEPKAKTKGKKK